MKVYREQRTRLGHKFASLFAIFQRSFKGYRVSVRGLMGDGFYSLTPPCCLLFTVRCTRFTVRRSPRRGFTYIEMLVVIALVALCFVPILHMFTLSMDEVQQYSDFGTSLQLGREAMEAVKNLRLTEAQLEAQGTVWMPPEKEPPLAMNGVSWKVKRYAVKNTDPLEVHVEVFREENLERPVLEFVTLLEDL